MSLLTIMIALVIVGVSLWLINAYIPMDPTVKRLLNIAVIVILVIWLLKGLGFWGYLSTVHV